MKLARSSFEVRDIDRRIGLVGPVDHLLRLAAELLLDDRHQRRIAEERLEHLVLVGVDSALDDILAEPPGGIDQHGLVEAGLGIDREHHARGAEVGAHHPLNADREGDPHMVEALGLAIGDRPVGEEGGIAAPAGVEERLAAANVEVGFLLSGEARLGQVLRGGARAHRDVEGTLALLLAELAIRVGDCFDDVVRPFAVQEGAANGVAGLGERQLAGLEIGEEAGDAGAQLVVIDEAPIGRRGRREAAGNAHALRRKGADHLAERGVLAADEGDVVAARLFEPDYVRRIGCHFWSLPR